jgi:hypothetical protein
MNKMPDAINRSDPIGSTFAPLIGLPAWGVQKGHGSMLTFEFGSPHLVIREPIANPSTDDPKIRKLLRRRHVVLHGAWNLWIYICHWRCIESSVEQCSDLSSDLEINEATKLMHGQQLTAVKIDAASRRSSFRFDLGVTLETWPHEGPDNDDQWLLFTPTGYVLTFRADGHYCWGPADQMPENEIWLPLPQQRT